MKLEECLIKKREVERQKWRDNYNKYYDKNPEKEMVDIYTGGDTWLDVEESMWADEDEKNPIYCCCQECT